MSAAKDTFEANTFEANTFACGTWRGIGALPVDWIYLCDGVGASPTATCIGQVPHADCVGASPSATMVGLPGSC